ncbi:carbohydrate ABC transporter permease [Vallitalea sediminicola]
MNSKKSNLNEYIINAIFIVISILFVIPILYIISISLTSERDILEYGYKLLPTNVTVNAYKYVFNNPWQIINSYGVSIFITVFGTLLSLFLSTMLAYTMSRKDYRYSRITSFIVFFTLLFNGGLVPTYILIVNYLHLKNTIWALILPYTINAWYVILLKGFLSTIPLALVEAARIDGASEVGTFFKIVIPLSKPALAAVGLLICFTYWNDWWLSLLYIDKTNIMPLQYLLYRIMANVDFLSRQAASSIGVNVREIPTESLRMAMCVIAAGPMLILFPFFQRYFVKGITVGSVKG